MHTRLSLQIHCTWVSHSFQLHFACILRSLEEMYKEVSKCGHLPVKCVDRGHQPSWGSTWAPLLWWMELKMAVALMCSAFQKGEEQQGKKQKQNSLATGLCSALNSAESRAKQFHPWLLRNNHVEVENLCWLTIHAENSGRSRKVFNQGCCSRFYPLNSQTKVMCKLLHASNSLKFWLIWFHVEDFLCKITWESKENQLRINLKSTQNRLGTDWKWT